MQGYVALSYLPYINHRNWIAAAGCILALGMAAPAFGQGLSLKSLQPSQGPERSLVTVEGSGLNDAVVVWDAGLPTEKKLARAFQGATMFSVPSTSSPGTHPVMLESPTGRSSALTFTVAGRAPPAVPRIDGITLAGTSFKDAGKVSAVLYVQGANIDVAAKVFIDGVETASVAHKAIGQNLFGADPAVLGYPIRHYLSRIVTEISRPLGSSITVRVANENGESSDPATYTLPADSKTFSSAGDGIADDQKINGYDNGSGKIDLKALGADPYRKIVFLQFDIMEGIPRPIEAAAGMPGALDLVKQMFANAPIINPYGDNGIDLAIDSSGSVRKFTYLAFTDEDDTKNDEGSFWKLKKDHFDAKRVGLYHYAIWGFARRDGASGYSNVDFDGCNVGDSFMVTMADFLPSYQTVQSQASTIAHELGHGLGQKHGGYTHSKRKPNYWSIMSYSWQLRTGKEDDFRRQYPTCTQIYYATPGAEEKNGQLPQQRSVRLDYSEGMGRTLVGNNNSLDEKSGVCGQPIDWNQNGKIDGKPVSARIDLDAVEGASIYDMPNWPNLRFDGPKLGGIRYP